MFQCSATVWIIARVVWAEYIRDEYRGYRRPQRGQETPPGRALAYFSRCLDINMNTIVFAAHY